MKVQIQIQTDESTSPKSNTDSNTNKVSSLVTWSETLVKSNSTASIAQKVELHIQIQNIQIQIQIMCTVAKICMYVQAKPKSSKYNPAESTFRLVSGFEADPAQSPQLLYLLC